MRLLLDAWLERTQPRLRIINADTGSPVLELDNVQLQYLLDSGEICLQDIQEHDLEQLHPLLQEAVYVR